jgi:hypothetical protein
MKKYIKKPIIVEAIQYDGFNFIEIFTWVYPSRSMIPIPENVIGTTQLIVRTLEGDMKANIGDYIIKGINGEFYPCRKVIFEKTYEQLS